MFAGRRLLCLPIAVALRYHPVALDLLSPMDRVLLLILPSTSVPPLPLFELFLCISLVAAADDDDDYAYADEYDFTTTPAADINDW